MVQDYSCVSEELLHQGMAVVTSQEGTETQLMAKIRRNCNHLGSKPQNYPNQFENVGFSSKLKFSRDECSIYHTEN